jgi:hypothetical protein
MRLVEKLWIYFLNFRFTIVIVKHLGGGSIGE